MTVLVAGWVVMGTKLCQMLTTKSVSTRDAAMQRDEPMPHHDPNLNTRLSDGFKMLSDDEEDYEKDDDRRR